MNSKPTLAHTPDPCAYAFICYAIESAADSVLTGSRGNPEGESMREVERAREGLLNGVMMALCGLPTLRAFMASFVPGYVECNDPVRLSSLVNLARLAWLDRMIETREIA